jgi:hypothetical protein
MNTTNRRHFLAVLSGASSLAAGAACTGENPSPEDDLERALEDLNRAAGIGIAPEDLEAARSYAAGAYREAAKSLRPIVLDAGLDLPIAFAAKRGSP